MSIQMSMRRLLKVEVVKVPRIHLLSTSITIIITTTKIVKFIHYKSKEDSHPSPLIAIVNEFLDGYYDNTVLCSSIWGEDRASDYEQVQVSSEIASTSSSTTATRAPASNTLSSSSIIAHRNERRWERFLHVLWATGYELRPTRSSSRKRSHSPSYAVSNKKRARVSQQKQTKSSFHPVHAWVRCICSPYLGLENARKHAVWSVLCDMYKRIPEEFREIDDDKTFFQTLAESKATNCKLSVEEMQDIVELIIEADYKSAFIPRQLDGRLIGHVAIENGWPCSLLSKKPSATCA